ncbi:hypothetical protein JD844_006250 [Phrynosoma platyrhinos]|uniref:DDE-1 domain-containing protein n=1 Tax=Phrynosoma platyrhinos TaxID=52577 RepID=A0ABQ7T1V6_PHRPL|nr:hypothetical protein JD844_006250 [Phrynosoma platyrhinos]
MERLLLLWIKGKEIAGDTVSKTVICEKAMAIFSDLVKMDGGEGTSDSQPNPDFKIIDLAWQEVTRRNLNSAWRKLWPDSVSTQGFEAVVDVESEVSKIVSLGKTMGLEVDDEDIDELIEEHNKELSTEELEEMQHMAVQEEFCKDQEEEEEAAILTSEIKYVL